MSISTNQRKRYAAVGTGGRVVMFIDPIASTFKDTAELVGLCDKNTLRAQYHRDRLHKAYGIPLVPTYDADNFDKMLSEQKPDVVIVCTVDALHDVYIVRALEAGCDVITEKPLTTDEMKCRGIIDAVKRTGRSVRVTFNVRWMPPFTQAKKIIESGAIGDVLSVNLEWNLDTSHGADYFRRWHSDKSQSGGLQIHKSTHHFDAVNWLINAIPETVFSFGKLGFYGKENAVARGDEALTKYARYEDAPDSDPFKFDIKGTEALTHLYKEAEVSDGYIRDKNVFREGITIEDSLALVVKYRNNVLLTYSLNAFCPQEGYRLIINGNKGRLELEHHQKSHVITGAVDDNSAPEDKNSTHLTVHPLFKPSYQVEIPTVEGGHGGGDPLLQKQMFGGNVEKDALGRDAGHEQGAASIAIGIAINRSLITGEPVEINDLFELNPKATKLSDLI